MDEIRWQYGLEEYRAVQQLAREGGYRAALERAYQALLVGGLGRRSAARLHSLLCWIYLFGLKQPSPVAVLHGEEAVRLADLCSDAWIRSEALARLIPAYCQMGDLARANQACDRLEREVGQNELVLLEGRLALWMLRALVSLAEGNSRETAHALIQAQGCAQHLPDKVLRLQGLKRFLEALEGVGQQTWTEADGWNEQQSDPHQGTGAPTPWLEEEGEETARMRAMVLEALLLEGSSLPTASELAKQALQRAMSTGRIDLATLVRRHLAHLLA